MNVLDDEDQEQQQVTISDMSLCPHSTPRGSDKEVRPQVYGVETRFADISQKLYLLKYPQTIGVAKRKFVPETWQPPVTHHHTKAAPTASFSPSQTSKTSVRWRCSSRKRRRLQSNSRLIRWTDGSLTMQMATNSMEQYELPAKPLAPPQRNPLKPTPTAMNRGKSANGSADYDARMDSHTYLASAHQSTGFLQITNHVTASLNVQATGEQEDDALIRLQESMAAAVKGNKTAADGSVPIISISEDPELAKKKAELAEREKIRAQRRRQNQEERERDRANRVLGRSGLRTGGMGGLTVGGLEDDDGMTTSRPKAKPARKPRRRNSEYSDDEEDYRNRGRTREDEYDEDDGFLVGSDEEPELIDDDDDEEEEELDEEESTAGKSKKLKNSTVGAGDDAAGARTKRRRVVDDDEDEV